MSKSIFASVFTGVFGALFAVFAAIVILGGGCAIMMGGCLTAVDSARESAREARRQAQQQQQQASVVPTTQPVPTDPASIKDQIRKLEAQIANLQSQGLDTLVVQESRFYWDKDVIAQPAIEIKVKNNSPHAVKRVYFRGVLQTPGRTLPWIDDTFNYSPPGGLEPGESAHWSLRPNMFMEWGKAPKDRTDMILATTVESFDTADDNEITITDNSAKIAQLRQQVANLKYKLAELEPEPQTQPEQAIEPEPQPPSPADVAVDAPVEVNEPEITPEPQLADEFRIWTSANGKFRINAALVEYKNGKVTLKKENLSLVDVPLDQLSDDDKAYVAETASGLNQETKPKSGLRF